MKWQIIKFVAEREVKDENEEEDEDEEVKKSSPQSIHCHSESVVMHQEDMSPHSFSKALYSSTEPKHKHQDTAYFVEENQQRMEGFRKKAMESELSKRKSKTLEETFQNEPIKKTKTTISYASEEIGLSESDKSDNFHLNPFSVEDSNYLLRSTGRVKERNMNPNPEKHLHQGSFGEKKHAHSQSVFELAKKPALAKFFSPHESNKDIAKKVLTAFRGKLSRETSILVEVILIKSHSYFC